MLCRSRHEVRRLLKEDLRRTTQLSATAYSLPSAEGQVVDYYAKKGRVNDVKADGNASDVAADIRTALKDSSRS